MRGVLERIAVEEREVGVLAGFERADTFVNTEQARGISVDARSDIYSLGCIVFEMVTGRLPFLDKTVGDLIIAHNTIAPPTPSDLVPTLPLAVDRAILKANEAAARIDAFLNGPKKAFVEAVEKAGIQWLQPAK